MDFWSRKLENKGGEKDKHLTDSSPFQGCVCLCVCTCMSLFADAWVCVCLDVCERVCVCTDSLSRGMEVRLLLFCSMLAWFLRLMWMTEGASLQGSPSTCMGMGL